MSKQRELELYGFTFLPRCCECKSTYKESKYSAKCRKIFCDVFASLFTIAILITTILLTTVMMKDELKYGRCDTHVKIKSGVERIPSYLLSDCTLAETIEFPESLVAIENFAFYYSRIRKFELPKSVRYIGGYAFTSSWIEEINLDFVEEIGSYAFFYTRLREIGQLSPKLTKINDSVFRNCPLTKLEIPEGVKTIGDYAFNYCYLKTIKLPSTLTSIEDGAFSDNSRIETLVIPDSVTYIGTSAFSYCSSLKTVILSKNLEYISSYLFANCSSLEEIVIPGSVQEISSNAFYYNSKLKKVTLQEGLRGISYSAFRNSGLTQLEFPDTLEAIGDYAFYDCGNLSSIKFGSNPKISKIGNSSFRYTRLTQFEFPDTVETIDDYAFYSCEKLSSIKFGLNSKISKINHSSFADTALTEVIFPESIKQLGSYSFNTLRTAKFRGGKNTVAISYSVFASNCQIIWNYVDIDDKQVY